MRHATAFVLLSLARLSRLTRPVRREIFAPRLRCHAFLAGLVRATSAEYLNGNDGTYPERAEDRGESCSFFELTARTVNSCS